MIKKAIEIQIIKETVALNRFSIQSLYTDLYSTTFFYVLQKYKFNTRCIHVSEMINAHNALRNNEKYHQSCCLDCSCFKKERKFLYQNSQMSTYDYKEDATCNDQGKNGTNDSQSAFQFRNFQESKTIRNSIKYSELCCFAF
jgi:hypothetical protein